MNKLLQLSENRLFLKTFRDLEEQILRLLPEREWIRVLLRGLLKALEQRLIAARASATVTEAIDAYRATEEPPTDWKDQVVISEQPSEVEGLPELRITSTIVERP